jgi:hypothetical protein
MMSEPKASYVVRDNVDRHRFEIELGDGSLKAMRARGWAPR